MAPTMIGLCDAVSPEIIGPKRPATYTSSAARFLSASTSPSLGKDASSSRLAWSAKDIR